MSAFSAAALSPDSVLFISLDSCRYDTARTVPTPALDAVGPLHRAHAPSYFTYGSHAAFWMGFTPGVPGCTHPWLNPKFVKLFRMLHGGSEKKMESSSFRLEGANLIEGFRRLGYRTIGTGAVEWFNPTTATGAVLGAPFEHFHFAGDTWSLSKQLDWIETELADLTPCQPVFLFLNVGETHVPYWHEGASWPRWPSPCVPFGGATCSARESRRRQRACLQWVDRQLQPLISRFDAATILVCADHGDCWGEDGLWEHGISHPATLTVPLWMRVRGQPVVAAQGFRRAIPSRCHTALEWLRRCLTVQL